MMDEFIPLIISMNKFIFIYYHHFIII